MIRKISAASALAVLGLAASGCSRDAASLSPSEVCASGETLGRIDHAMFDKAQQQASSQTRYALDSLSRQVRSELVRPLVESYDHDTRKTSCTASLDVWLPEGVTRPRELQSAIRYDSQPTADGREVVFNVSGLEALADGIAGADLSRWADVHAPRKPGLVVEVVPRGPEAPMLAQSPASRPVVAPRSFAAAAPQVFKSQVVTPAPLRAPPVASRTPVLAESAPRPNEGDGPVRVFVHVSDASALAAADHVRVQLAQLDIEGAPVATPPVRFVADMPRRTEVRCLKHAECPAARRVAAYLAARLGDAIAVIDMSSTYEHDPGVRPGSLELWLSRTSLAALP